MEDACFFYFTYIFKYNHVCLKNYLPLYLSLPKSSLFTEDALLCLTNRFEFLQALEKFSYVVDVGLRVFRVD